MMHGRVRECVRERRAPDGQKWYIRRIRESIQRAGSTGQDFPQLCLGGLPGLKLTGKSGQRERGR